MRIAVWIVVGIVIMLGSVVFHVKYRVSGLENEWLQAQQAIREGREAVKILHAEWSHLSEPGRLQAFSDKFLQLKPTLAQQVVDLSEVVRVVEEETVTQGHLPVTEVP